MFVAVHARFFLTSVSPPLQHRSCFSTFHSSHPALPSFIWLPSCLSPSISLLCTIGTRVAPSERAVKRPYKKLQHREERVMMKFNCSSWCTWGLAHNTHAHSVLMCGYLRLCVFACVFAEQEAWALNRNWPAGGVNVTAQPWELSHFKDALKILWGNSFIPT